MTSRTNPLGLVDPRRESAKRFAATTTAPLHPMCAGYGQFFSLKNPDKRTYLTEYPTFSYADILAHVYNPITDTPKENGPWIIPSSYNQRTGDMDARGKRGQTKYGKFWLLAADIDTGNLDLATVGVAMEGVLDAGTEFLVYATRSSTSENKKWRPMVPLAAPISGEHFHYVAEAFNAALTARCGVPMDNVTSRVQQYLYLPNKGEHYDVLHQLGNPWGHGKHFSTILEIAAELKAEDELKKEELKQQREMKRLSVVGLEGASAIDAFNDAVSVEHMLDACGFVPRHNGSEWHHPELQETKSYGTRLDDDGEGWVTASGSVTDFMGRKNGDAFDLFTAFVCGGDLKLAVQQCREQFGLNDKLTEQTRKVVRHMFPLGGFFCDGQFWKLRIR